MRAAILRGIRRSASGYLWLLKILIPVALATALLDYSGWIHPLGESVADPLNPEPLRPEQL